MKRALAVALCLPVLFGVGITARADHSWASYHWKRASNPVSLTVVDSVTSVWDASLTGAVSDWNASAAIDLQTVAGKTGKTERKRCVTDTGQIRVCNASYGKNGWLGIAEVWLSGDGHIAKARTKLNDSYFGTAQYNKPAWRNFVTCQEIGHDFGLDHQDENFGNANLGSCMDYTNDPSTNQHPNAHDFEHLETIYGHLDGGVSAAGTTGTNMHVHSADGDHRVSTDGEHTKLTFIYRAR